MKKHHRPLFASGFSQLSKAERLQILAQKKLLTPEEIDLLNQTVAPQFHHIADKLIENSIGCFALPLGVVADFPIDDQFYTVPMVIEETSVIAAVSKIAKWVRQSGFITTQQNGQEIIGQIQFATIKDFSIFKQQIEQQAAAWIAMANDHVVPNLVARGGGVTRLDARAIQREDGYCMAVIHVYMNPCNAMGANIINQVCEFLKIPIELATHEKVTMCILSNLVDTKLTTATLTINNIDRKLGEKIVEAGLFAKYDPYRAATHNKGVMNGMDAVLIATGNDWRAVEAAVHAYAAKSGQYRAMTDWQLMGNDLIGTITAPIIVGTVGGVTRLHPLAKLSLKILGIQHADELARIIAAVGLVQNLAALRALTSEGIVHGHMKLHIDNLLLAAGASELEMLQVRPLAEAWLKQHHKITQSDVVSLLMKWRKDYNE